MEIRLNGKQHPLPHPQTIQELLAAINLDANRVAVELNRNIVARESFDSTVLNSGDQVEVVQFVGGG